MKRWTNILAGIQLAGGSGLASDRRSLSSAGRAALDTAIWLSRRFGASLHLLTAIDADDLAEAMIVEAQRTGRSTLSADAARILDRLAEPRREEGVSVTTCVRLGRPGPTLVDVAARNGRDLIVVGARERGAATQATAGRTASYLARRSPVPIWFARRPPPREVRVVEAAVSQAGESTIDVVRAAAALAIECDARLEILYVVDTAAVGVLRMGAIGEAAIDTYRSRRTAAAGAAIARLVEEAEALGCAAVARLRDGERVGTIVADSRDAAADVLVIGASEESGTDEPGDGRLDEGLVANAKARVLVVRRPAAAP